MESPDRLLTVQDVAERLSVSRSLIYQLMDRGELAYVRIGRARRIPPGEIERYIAANMQGAWAINP